MKALTPKAADGTGLFGHPTDFSLVLGGPLFQLLRRAHLADDALTMARQRIIVISLFAWLPLLVLSVLEGRALGSSVAVPFLRDVEVHIRYLIALPLLIGAELVVHRRMRSVVEVFLERRLIPESAMPRFDAAIASAFRWRNSVLAEVLLIAFVYGVGILIVWRQYLALDASTWYATPSADGTTLSFAGIWYGYVSLPLFQFLLVRWYFRLFIWARLLWQVSRIELEPDSDASGSSRRPRIPFRDGLRVHAARGGARRDARRPARQPHLLPRRAIARVQGRDRRVACLRAGDRDPAVAGVRAPACTGEANGPARIRHVGRALRARVRRQVAARRCARRRGLRRQRRHPVARGSRQQLRQWCRPCAPCR